MKLSLIILAVVLAAYTSGYAQNVHTNPLCWDHPRILFYGTDTDVPQFEAWQKAHLVRRVERAMPPGYERSPNGAYAMHLGMLEVSDGYELLVFNERPYLVSVRMTGVKSVQNLRWVSEHLLSLRVWLGRIAGVDLLFNAESEAFERVEAFHDGTIAMQQWRESCAGGPLQDTEQCNPTCYRLEEQ